MVTNPDMEAARDLLERTPLHNTKEHNLAAAQVYATLAVEQAVRDLIEKIGDIDAINAAITGRPS